MKKKSQNIHRAYWKTPQPGLVEHVKSSLNRLDCAHPHNAIELQNTSCALNDSSI